MKYSERSLIILLTSIQVLIMLDFVIMMPLGPVLMESFKILPKEFGILISSYTFSAAVAGIIGGLFFDRFGRKSTLVFIFVGFIIGTLFCGIANSYFSMLLARSTAGFFGGLVGGIIFSIVGDLVPAQRRGRAIGTIMSSFSICSVLGIPLGLFLASKISWHAPFFLIVFLSFPVLAGILIILPKLNSHVKNKSDRPNAILNIFEVLKDRQYLIAFMVTLLVMLSTFSIVPFITPFAVFNIGLSVDQLPYIYLAGGSVTFFTSIHIGKLADKFGKYNIFLVMALISIVPVLIYTNMSQAPLAVALLSTTFLMVFLSGRNIPAIALVMGTARVDSRGSFMSLNTSFQQFGSAIASYIGGSFITKTATGTLIHYNHTAYFSIFTLICALGLASFLKKPDLQLEDQAGNLLES